MLKRTSEALREHLPAWRKMLYFVYEKTKKHDRKIVEFTVVCLQLECTYSTGKGARHTFLAPLNPTSSFSFSLFNININLNLNLMHRHLHPSLPDSAAVQAVDMGALH